MASHRLLSALKASKPALGAWLTLPGATHARTLALSSPHLDFIVIDSEHGLVSLIPGAAESIAAIESISVQNKISSIVRIPATGASDSTSWQIKYALDAGARGVLVPMVSTAAQARRVVEDSRFPPAGRRGFGSPFTQSVWGLSTAPEYFASANKSVLVIVQIETAEAVQNIEEIASVDGIDALFIGPYDLSLSLGFPTPNPDPHPQVESVIQNILTLAHKHGKKCAFFCTSGTQVPSRVSQGFDMINVTSDTNALTEGIARNLDAALGKKPE